MATNPDGLDDVGEARKLAFVLAGLIPADQVDELAAVWADHGWVPWFTERWFADRVGDPLYGAVRESLRQMRQARRCSPPGHTWAPGHADVGDRCQCGAEMMDVASREALDWRD